MMRKDNNVQFRISTAKKASMQATANEFGLTMSDLFSILAFQCGPKEYVRLIMSSYGLRLLTGLGLPPEAMVVFQKDAKAVTAFSNIFRLSVAVETATLQEDFELSKIYQKHLDKAESDFYRAYGKALIDREPVEGHHVTDNE